MQLCRFIHLSGYGTAQSLQATSTLDNIVDDLHEAVQQSCGYPPCIIASDMSVRVHSYNVLIRLVDTRLASSLLI
jgi:hypothetical protein